MPKYFFHSLSGQTAAVPALVVPRCIGGQSVTLHYWSGHHSSLELLSPALGERTPRPFPTYTYTSLVVLRRQTTGP